MTPALRESRDDVCHGGSMPNVIHLTSSSSAEKPTIVESSTGYEVINSGRESLESSLIVGRGDPISLHVNSMRYKGGCRSGSEQSQINKQHKDKNDVIKAFSLVRSSSNLSDITFQDENEHDQQSQEVIHFEPERLAL
ncbi:expressed unknown protein [Seminavis robusta]|uniref:Uncharacterized protein n=1 Tax=Seminavis robusta TaxID=568900 RepID=A0A9N8DD32_9STRA|nr:expressed unknown protein [Seminavis robusta]|eukprot:Sro84_g044620.1 n/a (138) ;mRNA; f:8381-8794